MPSIVHTFRRFVVLSICFVRHPSVALARYCDAVALWRSSRALADLSYDQLLDIGLTSEDLQREINRPFMFPSGGCVTRCTA